MRHLGFSLYTHSDTGIKNCCNSETSEFSFRVSEQKDGSVTIVKGRLSAHTRLELFWLDVTFKEQAADLSFYANGFQSWSESPYIDSHKKIKKLWGLPGSMFRLKNFGDYYFSNMASKAGGSYSHMYLDLEEKGKSRVFYGDLKPYDSYTMFSVDYDNDTVTAGSDIDGIVLEEGESLDIFKICIVPDSDTWFGIMGIDSLPAEKLTGWTSWYNYYTKITEYILEANMKSLSEADIPMDVFQIDDGYFTNAGDWLEVNDRFPGGMKALSDKIKGYGWVPGIWSAPFITDNKSIIFKEHSDWILRTSKGKLQTAGWNPNWTGVFYALDIYNEEFRAYLKEVYNTTIGEWGYELLKLDFLYAAALQPREGKSRCRVMADAMDLLLELTNGAKILACGAPLSPSLGKCHYCRIGGDISHVWEDKLLKTINYRERVSTAASISNTKSRNFLSGKVFLNDPDVFILRNTKEIKMSDKQKKILFETNMTHSGLVFFSDDVTMYEDSQIEMVKEAFSKYKEQAE